VFICFVRILWVMYILPLNNVYEMVFISYPVSWICAAVAATVVYLYAKRKLVASLESDEQ